ncbi:unnamed protein product [Ixodes pacificus]
MQDVKPMLHTLSPNTHPARIRAEPVSELYVYIFTHTHTRVRARIRRDVYISIFCEDADLTHIVRKKVPQPEKRMCLKRCILSRCGGLCTRQPRLFENKRKRDYKTKIKKLHFRTKRRHPVCVAYSETSESLLLVYTIQETRY